MSEISNPTISILLPTRGRTEALDRSIMSLIKSAAEPEKLQILIAFDSDDTESVDYFIKNIQSNIEIHNVRYTCLSFDPLGYIRLNEYVNGLANIATGDWLMFWNDDAIMESEDWDKEIIKHTGNFCCLRMPTHNEHPYAIFPIVPKKWFELFGYLSAHQISDAWISQISYMLDIVRNINVKVIHDRHDLTGNNKDDTFENRPMLEGNPNNPIDFNHYNWRDRRIRDAIKINEYLKTIGQDTEWFKNILAGKQDPWEKMCGLEYDPNKQLMQYKVEIKK
jgi:hypothetical protein